MNQCKYNQAPRSLARYLFHRALKNLSFTHEQGFEPLQRTLKAVEDKFGPLLPQMQWINFGGGHHVTAPGYQLNNHQLKLVGWSYGLKSGYGSKTRCFGSTMELSWGSLYVGCGEFANRINRESMTGLYHDEYATMRY